MCGRKVIMRICSWTVIYTPQNNLRTSSFIFPLFNIEIDGYSFRVNMWAKEIFAAFFFDKHNMLAISVAIKMSVVPTRSDQKILRKMGISEIQVFTLKWNIVRNYEIFFIYNIENNNLWQTKYCTNVFIWDKRHKDNSRKIKLPFERWKLPF